MPVLRKTDIPVCLSLDRDCDRDPTLDTLIEIYRYIRTDTILYLTFDRQECLSYNYRWSKAQSGRSCRLSSCKARQHVRYQRRETR
jgi:hypothetical protein